MYKAEGDQDRVNKEIRRLVLEEGRLYIGQTILNGQSYLRISLMNPLTPEDELQDIEEKATSLIPNLV